MKSAAKSMVEGVREILSRGLTCPNDYISLGMSAELLRDLAGHNPGDEVDELLEQADEAMLQAPAEAFPVGQMLDAVRNAEDEDELDEVIHLARAGFRAGKIDKDEFDMLTLAKEA